MLRALLIMAYVAVTVYCIADVRQSDDPHPYGLPRWAWILMFILFPFLGAGTWLVFKYTRRDGQRGRAHQVAPDDDPEYLTWLREQERRRRQQGKSDGPA